MSWSLQVAHGDLQIGSGGLNTVTGASKLTQDLRCALLEAMGTDPLHPSYGSVIDGGVDANGNLHTSIVGQPNDAHAAAFIQSEVQRVCQVYQSYQIARNQADVATYGKSTLTANEALLSIGAINVQQIMDQALVTANLTTGSGGLPLSVPFSASS